MARARGGARRSIGGCPHQALARQDEAISRLGTVPRCELPLSARTEHSGREFPSGRRQPKAQSRSVKWTGAVGRFPQSRPGKHHGPGGAGIPYAVCARIPWFWGRRPLGAAPAQTNPRSPRGGPFRRSNRPRRSCQLVPNAHGGLGRDARTLHHRRDVPLRLVEEGLQGLQPHEPHRGSGMLGA